MATECSHLEAAIFTLVRVFHRAANNRPSMSVTQFRTLVAGHMPRVAQELQNKQNLDQILQMMGVQYGQNISFENFWMFVEHQANRQYGMEKQGDSSCRLL